MVKRALTALRTARKYKHVYFHKASKTWIAVRKGGHPCVSSVDQDTAAKLAAKMWKVSRASLKLPEAAETIDTVPSQSYKHVTWHSGRKLWVVQGKGKYLGCASDQMVAVRIACTSLRCKPADLALQKARRACSTSSDTCQRMALLMRVYAGKKTTEPMVPADIQHLMHKAATSKKSLMHSETGRGVVFPYIISKFPIHRDAIAHASAASGAGKCTEASLYQTLLLASRMMSGQEIVPTLRRNVGRKSMHHASFVMFASTGLKMLSLVQKRIAKPNQEILEFGKTGKYAVMPMNRVMKHKLSGLIAFGKALATSKPPRTLADWREEVDRLTVVMRSPPRVPGCSGTYRGTWAIRCGLIYHMRQQGILSLKVERGDTVRDFLGNFPDQKSQVLAVAGGKYYRHRRMLDVFSECGHPLRIQGVKHIDRLTRRQGGTERLTDGTSVVHVCLLVSLIVGLPVSPCVQPQPHVKITFRF